MLEVLILSSFLLSSSGTKLNLATDFGWLQVYRESIQKRTSVLQTAKPAESDAVATGELIDFGPSSSPGKLLQFQTGWVAPFQLVCLVSALTQSVISTWFVSQDRVNFARLRTLA